VFSKSCIGCRSPLTVVPFVFCRVWVGTYTVCTLQHRTDIGNAVKPLIGSSQSCVLCALRVLSQVHGRGLTTPTYLRALWSVFLPHASQQDGHSPRCHRCCRSWRVPHVPLTLISSPESRHLHSTQQPLPLKYTRSRYVYF
jgi:hypothetical protein